MNQVDRSALVDRASGRDVRLDRRDWPHRYRLSMSPCPTVLLLYRGWGWNGPVNPGESNHFGTARRCRNRDVETACRMYLSGSRNPFVAVGLLFYHVKEREFNLSTVPRDRLRKCRRGGTRVPSGRPTPWRELVCGNALVRTSGRLLPGFRFGRH